jgi:deoxyribodipyrimidine photolyase-related protein
LDRELSKLERTLNIPIEMHSTEHFLTERKEVSDFFGKKKFLMENFYRHMRKKYEVLLENEDKPTGGAWNFDQENRKKLPKDIRIPDPHTYSHDLSDIHQELRKADVNSFGEVDSKNFIWPLNRNEALETFDYFLTNLLDNFGPYQDALDGRFWSNFHSRISFAMNLKMISPLEVIKKAEEALDKSQQKNLASVEGFIRQILGWREYMRGVYWAKMPDYENLNFFEFKNKLPGWFWTGDTKMACMQHSIGQSLEYAYAHHIQRLMITGNFALLLQTDPNYVDEWYLGVYIDAIQWVEITNTRGMSQYADGGLLSSKPYVSSANYVNKMSNYCSGCHYNHKEKTTENACPFNALYWHFLESQSEKLRKNPRMSMPYRILDKMTDSDRQALSEKALDIIENKDTL